MNEGRAYLRSCPSPKCWVYECVPAGVCLFVKVTMPSLCKLFALLVVYHFIYVCIQYMHAWALEFVFDWACIQGEAKSICLSRIKMPETRKEERSCSKLDWEGMRAKQMSLLLLTCLLVTFLLPDVQLVSYHFDVEYWPPVSRENSCIPCKCVILAMCRYSWRDRKQSQS